MRKSISQIKYIIFAVERLVIANFEGSAERFLIGFFCLLGFREGVLPYYGFGLHIFLIHTE